MVSCIRTFLKKKKKIDYHISLYQRKTGKSVAYCILCTVVCALHILSNSSAQVVGGPNLCLPSQDNKPGFSNADFSSLFLTSSGTVLAK